MKSANFVVLGDTAIAAELGKKGSVTDITFYERKSHYRVSTFVIPSGFPDKMQPLIQSIVLAETPILNVTKIDKSLGEQIVALDSMKMRTGFIIPNGFDNEVRNLVKDTSLEGYEILSLDELKQKLDLIESPSIEGKAKILVDAAFEVKGVGTVALGVVRRGLVRKHDELEMFPHRKPVTIRSIQMHDEDVESAESPARVGVALKGTDAHEISRGEVIASKDSLISSTEINVRFEKSRFYKQDVNESSSYHLCIGLQIKPVKVKFSGDDLLCFSEKPFAFEKGERCVVLDLNSASVRIVGSGTVL